MDTSGKTRAEIDALRELAAKAHAEGADWGRHTARSNWHNTAFSHQWAAEEIPYPTVTRLRVVEVRGTNPVALGVGKWRSEGGCLWHQLGSTWIRNMPMALLESLASLLTRDQLLAIANGVCGPTEEVTP